VLNRAATLGAGQPENLLPRLRRPGFALCEGLRAAIHSETGADRFRPSPWLTGEAILETEETPRAWWHAGTAARCRR
jgi:hypothetical protein